MKTINISAKERQMAKDISDVFFVLAAQRETSVSRAIKIVDLLGALAEGMSEEIFKTGIFNMVKPMKGVGERSENKNERSRSNEHTT